MLNIVDEFTQECLAIKVARKRNSMDEIEKLAGCAGCRHKDQRHRAKTAYIERGSPWENGYVERPRDELLNGEIFTALRAAHIVVEGRRQLYNRVRPHSALG